jgi:hypothetical protein
LRPSRLLVPHGLRFCYRARLCRGLVRNFRRCNHVHIIVVRGGVQCDGWKQLPDCIHYRKRQPVSYRFLLYRWRRGSSKLHMRPWSVLSVWRVVGGGRTSTRERSQCSIALWIDMSSSVSEPMHDKMNFGFWLIERRVDGTRGSMTNSCTRPHAVAWRLCVGSLTDNVT